MLELLLSQEQIAEVKQRAQDWLEQRKTPSPKPSDRTRRRKMKHSRGAPAKKLPTGNFVPNPASSGNGALALVFHVGRPWRAVPEKNRWSE